MAQTLPRLQTQYRDTVIPQLMKDFSYANINAVPALKKISVNMGLGEAVQNSKIMDEALAEITMITGQKPVIRLARKSIASFKIREGMPIGCMVTLRRDRMYEFLDRLISIVFPRVRDFRGFAPSSFDGNGNFTIGLRDQLVFPEVDYTKVETVKGMNVTFATSAKTDPEAKRLFELFGFPFTKRQERG